MFSKEAVKCKYQSAMYSICSVSDNVIGDCDRWMDLICLNIVGSSTMLFSIGRRVQYMLGCANKDLWALCAPIFIIVVYCRTAPSYFFGGKE